MTQRKIGIIGGGFAGTMFAVNMIRESNKNFELVIINESETLAKGVAFNPYSRSHLLNVATAKMSAFPDQPDHFQRWVMQLPEYTSYDSVMVANAFLPRYVYGQYLTSVWEDALRQARSKNISVRSICSNVRSITGVGGSSLSMVLDNGQTENVDACVVATGNHLPRNPKIKNGSFFSSKNYFQNPWDERSVAGIHSNLPVLIIGNGLTMVDTVIGLQEKKYKGPIYSISPNGFNILPHRHNGMRYAKLVDELTGRESLQDLVRLFFKHVREVRRLGVSAEPVIDSLRPHTQYIWARMTVAEKKLFMARFRHLWGVARHRIPLHIHDIIQQLRMDGSLHVCAGTIHDMHEDSEGIHVEYFDKAQGEMRTITVSRVINCTGPDTDFRNSGSFLGNCVSQNLFGQDPLRLGLLACTSTFRVMDPEGRPYQNIFTIGSTLKGMLWESTAVNELRDQACRLAQHITQSVTSAETETLQQEMVG